MDSESYWNLTGVRPVCPCGNPTKFVNISLGYKNFCGHSCAAKAWRAEMKEDAGRFDSFRQKVSANMVKEWDARPENARSEIFAKAANTNRSRIAELSDEERAAKFSHNPAGFYESLERYWNVASEEEKVRVFGLIRERADATMASRTPREYIDAQNAKIEKWIQNGGFDHITKTLGA